MCDSRVRFLESELDSPSLATAIARAVHSEPGLEELESRLDGAFNQHFLPSVPRLPPSIACGRGRVGLGCWWSSAGILWVGGERERNKVWATWDRSQDAFVMGMVFAR
jgi:hypothetical protein